MRRRAALVAIALLAADAALAQRSARPPRVGVLFPGSSKESRAIQREPFERGLREHGWKPGATILIDYRYADGDSSRLNEHAADLVRSGVDVIVARSGPALAAAPKRLAWSFGKSSYFEPTRPSNSSLLMR